MRAGIAIVAVLGLRRDAGDDDQDRLFINARGHLYEIMGVSASQMEAKKRAASAGSGQMNQIMASKREVSRSLQGAHRRAGGHRGGAGHRGQDDDDDDDGGDD